MVAGIGNSTDVELNQDKSLEKWKNIRKRNSKILAGWKNKVNFVTWFFSVIASHGNMLTLLMLKVIRDICWADGILFEKFIVLVEYSLIIGWKIDTYSTDVIVNVVSHSKDVTAFRLRTLCTLVISKNSKKNQEFHFRISMFSYQIASQLWMQMF